MRPSTVVAAFLLAAPAFIDAKPFLSNDIADKSQLDQLLSDDIPDESQSEQPLYKHGLRHRSHANPAFLKYDHHLHQWADDSNVADLVDDTVATPMTLPGRHPSVEKALDSMAGDLQNLQQKQQAAKELRGELEGTVTNAVHHRNDAMGMKQAMAKKEAQLRREKGKLQALEKDEGRLGDTRSELVSSLHRMLGPKIMKARARFEKKEVVLHKEEQATMAWKAKTDQLKASAMELIKKKKESHQSFLQAEEEVAQAKKKQELARIQYEHDRVRTGEEVQSYRYAETRFKAELTHEQAAKTSAMAARKSVENLHEVYGIEQKKVDQSIGFRKYRLEHQIQEVQAAQQKSSQELTDLEQRYREWQQMQRERTAAVVKQSQETATASEVYAAGQKQVLDSASAKVVRDAESMGDWDGWGSDDSNVHDEDDE